jgi:hypothetical protein
MHTYIHVYVYTHTYVHRCMHACIHAYIQHACIHLYIYTNMHDIHKYIHMCMHIYITYIYRLVPQRNTGSCMVCSGSHLFPRLNDDRFISYSTQLRPSILTRSIQRRPLILTRSKFTWHRAFDILSHKKLYDTRSLYSLKLTRSL